MSVRVLDIIFLLFALWWIDTVKKEEGGIKTYLRTFWPRCQMKKASKKMMSCSHKLV